MAELLRTFLDQPPGRPRTAPPRGGRTPIPHPQDRKRPMIDPATMYAFGALTEPATLTLQRLLPGPIERIWAYLTESDLRRQWLAAAQMDLKVGAPFELVWRNDELTDPPGQRPPGFHDEHRMQSRITEVDPPRKLAFTWNNSG